MESLIFRLGLALAIGLLVGLERGWQARDAREGGRTAGIRTFGITGLLGGISAAVAMAFDEPAVFYVTLAVFSFILAWFKSREGHAEADFSVTGVVAAIAVFALGGLAVKGDQTAAAAGGAVLAAILASRQFLHSWLKRVSWQELRAAVLLAAMTAIILPVLPNRTLDPWGGLNPREIWFFTVLIATISYVGYIAIRVFGRRAGILFSTISGAVVSSTAVTLSLGRRAATGDAPIALSGAASLAACISAIRVLLVLGIVNRDALLSVAPALLAAAAVFCIAGAVLFLSEKSDLAVDSRHTNPFDIAPLLIFGVTFAAVAVISAFLKSRFGASGIVVTSTVSSLVDVDVAVLSAVRDVSPDLTVETLKFAIIGAFSGNAVARSVLAFSVGSWKFGLPYALATAVAVVSAIGISAI